MDRIEKIASYLKKAKQEIATTNDTRLIGDLYLRGELKEKDRKLVPAPISVIFVIEKSNDKNKGDYKLTIINQNVPKDSGLFIDNKTYNKLKPSINAINEIEKGYNYWKNKKPIENNNKFDDFHEKARQLYNKNLIHHELFHRISRLYDLH